jgi:uncharacterized membrane protein
MALTPYCNSVTLPRIGTALRNLDQVCLGGHDPGEAIRMTVLRALVLIVATIATALTAGAFVLYAHTVMPGLARIDDRTFVAAFQALDRAIVNPWFLVGGFLGAPAWTALAVVLSQGRPALPWTVAALLAALGCLCWALVLHGQATG